MIKTTKVHKFIDKLINKYIMRKRRCVLPKSKFEQLSDIVKQYADVAREHYDYKPGNDLIDVFKKENFIIEFIKEYSKIDGEIIIDPNNNFRKLTISTFGGMNRFRFTLAHELGHFIIHSQWGNNPYESFRDENKNINEKIANMFAAYFLMPEKEVRKLVEKKYPIEYIANYFGVSVLAMKYQLENLKLNESY